ncbi:MAG: hypothetical protein ACI9E1_002458 [Cryomorphaceae bacterium]|jgi:hypothetical protein
MEKPIPIGGQITLDQLMIDNIVELDSYLG